MLDHIITETGFFIIWSITILICIGHILRKYPKDYFVIKSGHGKCVTMSDCDETYDDCNGATFTVKLEDCQTVFSSALSS